MLLPIADEIMAEAKPSFAPGVRPVSRGAALPRVEIYENPAAVMSSWQQLVSIAPASVYQTPSFLLPWMETLGTEAKLKPLFILQRDTDGTPLAFFALGVRKLGPLRLAVFLGAKDSNFNLGLFHPSYRPDRKALLTLFKAAARAMGRERPDILLLFNQPLDWNGWTNPLAHLRRQRSPSFAYKSEIGRDAEIFFTGQLSKDSRKKYRKKEQRLREHGELRYAADETDPALRARIIAAFFQQKIARFEDQDIESSFTSATRRHFVEMSAHADARQAARLELHALVCGEKIVAVYGGATHQGHFSGYFNSFDSDPEISKTSPADLLLFKLIAAKCAAGVTSFDLGIGEARYKRMVCNETVALFDSFVPLSIAGHMLAPAVALAQYVKRRIKENPRAFKLARRMRSMMQPRLTSRLAP